MVFAYNIHKPDYIFSALTSVPANAEVQRFVDKPSAQFPASQLLLTGYQVVGQDLQLPNNCTVINSIEDLIPIAEV